MTHVPRLFVASILVASFAVAAGTAVANRPTGPPPDLMPEIAGQTAAGRPNILLLGSDGLNMNRTSLDGYERDTTPFLARFARQALVFENAFPNGASTASSTTSMLTGRLPAENGVIYPPDIARGDAVYQHLPGLLRRLGYRTGQISIRWYADSAPRKARGPSRRRSSRRRPTVRSTSSSRPTGCSGRTSPSATWAS